MINLRILRHNISKGFKEKKLKAPNVETAFVSDFWTC